MSTGEAGLERNSILRDTDLDAAFDDPLFTTYASPVPALHRLLPSYHKSLELPHPVIITDPRRGGSVAYVSLFSSRFQGLLYLRQLPF